jgi:hypothetical protein
VLIDCTDYAFLYVKEFVQLEPDKLIDVGAELDSLAGNKIRIVWHLVVLSEMAMLQQLTNNLQSSSCDLKNLSYGSSNGCEGFSHWDREYPLKPNALPVLMPSSRSNMTNAASG